MNSSETKKKTRVYATPEESDATIPIFTTPTTMYKSARAYSGPIPLPKTYNNFDPYAPKSPETSYNKRESFSPKQGNTETKETLYTKRDSFQKPQPPPPTNPIPSPQQNKSLLEKDKILAQLIDMGFTLEASKVAYDASTGKDFQSILDILIQNQAKPPKPSKPTRKGEKENPISVDSSGDEAEDDNEEVWRKKQEERRREYLDEMKRNKPTPPMPNMSAPSNSAPTPPPHYQYPPPHHQYPPPPSSSSEPAASSPRRHQPSPFLNAHNPSNTSSPASSYNTTNNNNSNNSTRRSSYQSTYNPSKSQPPPQPQYQQQQKQQQQYQHSYTSSTSSSSTFNTSQNNNHSYTSNSPFTSSVPPHTSKARNSSSLPPDPLLISVDLERKQGNFLFNQGKVAEAEASYSLAMSFLPPLHDQLVILSNNRAAARLKQGKYDACLQDCATAAGIAQNNMSKYGSDAMDLHNGISWKSQVIKALHRKACALEGLKKYEAAIQVYEEYVRLDGTRSLEVSQGIQRCRQAMMGGTGVPQQQQQQQQNWKPANDNATSFPDIDFNIFIPKKETPANMEEINNSKAVKEMREREKKKEKEEMERLEKQDKVDYQINAWKMGKEKNLRALLASLDGILWAGVQWKSVTMTDILDPKRCKITYMKAIAKVHPDKLPANATVEQRLLASSIFTCLNQAWDVFKTENNF